MTSPALDTPVLDSSEPLCVVCDRRKVTTPALLCERCTGQLRADLDELVSGYAWLDPTPGSHSGATATRPAPCSRPPARLAVLALTDQRRQTYRSDTGQAAHMTSAGAGAGVLPVLAYWVEVGIAEGVLPEQAARGSVGAAVGTLRLWLGRLGEQWWIGHLVADVDALLREVRTVLGEVELTVPLGRCPVLADEHDAAWAATFELADDGTAVLAREALLAEHGCRGEVRARAYGHSARCGRCGARWDTIDELRQLGEWLGDALLDAPGLARYLGISVELVRSWAHRDRWVTRKVGRRTLYPLSAARVSYARRRLGGVAA